MVSLFRSTTQNPMSVGLSWRAPAKGTVTQYNVSLLQRKHIQILISFTSE